MTPESAADPAVGEVYCGHCGEVLSAPVHDDCAERLRMEPPRFCAHCRRRMQVQVTPTSWAARCVEHGELTSR